MQPRDAVEKWLSNIKGAVCYPDKFEVVFPSKCETCPEALSVLRKTISEEFGGTSEFDGQGCWVDKKGKEICEPVKHIFSSHHCADKKVAEKLGNALITATEKAKQEALFVGAGNKFFVIPKESLTR